MSTSSTPTSGSIYTDFQGLNKLKAAAGRHDPAAARQAVQQFEGLFLQMMLHSMREATPHDGLTDSRQTQFFQGMMDKQVANDMAQHQSTGLQPLLMRQLGLTASSASKKQQTAAVGANLVAQSRAAGALPATAPLRRGGLTSAPPKVTATGDGVPLKSAVNAPWRPQSPLQFVQDIWPQAVSAGKELGVPPRALVAQAALESGWGAHVIPRSDGQSSYNLFGIKAGSQWDGDQVRVGSVEYRNGTAVRESAGFRAYHSVADCFRDYVRLIGQNPRYQTALKQTEPAQYVQALQKAGYATDPDYAAKISAILKQYDIPAMAGAGDQGDSGDSAAALKKSI